MNAVLDLARNPEGSLGLMLAADMALSHRPYYEAVAGALPPGRRLEIGCGDAANAHLVGTDYVGVDHSSTMIAAAQRNAPWGRFICADIEAAELPESDVGLAVNVIQWLARPLAALIAVRSALRPGGGIIIGTPDPDCPRRPHVDGVPLCSGSRLLALLGAAGYRNSAVQGIEMPALRYLIGSAVA